MLISPFIRGWINCVTLAGKPPNLDCPNERYGYMLADALYDDLLEELASEEWELYP